MGGYLLIHLNRDAELPAQWPWAVAALVGIGLALHLVIRWRLPYADPLILPLVMLLNGLGLAMIHRIDLGNDPVMHSAELQLIWTAIAAGACCLLIIFLRDHRLLQRYTYTMFLAGMVLLMLPLVPGLGLEKNGAQIWIQLGDLQLPARRARQARAVDRLRVLPGREAGRAGPGRRARPGHRPAPCPRPRADPGDVAGQPAVLVFQKDLGTSLLFFGLFVMMLYVATERPSWPILGTVLFVGGAYLGYLLFDHVKIRVSAWLDPFSELRPELPGDQRPVRHGLGRSVRHGLGAGRPNLTPLAKTDFIAAAIGEELGVAGLMAVIVIYGLIVFRGLRAALRRRDPFGKLLAAGLAFVFALQVFAIIGGVTRLLPLTGLTTPFMSQGGSSLIANWVIVGLLMVISHQVRRPAAEQAVEPQQWLEAETTQMIPVGATVRPGCLLELATAGGFARSAGRHRAGHAHQPRRGRQRAHRGGPVAGRPTMNRPIRGVAVARW